MTKIRGEVEEEETLAKDDGAEDAVVVWLRDCKVDGDDGDDGDDDCGLDCRL